MSVFSIVIKPFEFLAGESYPDVWGTGDRYDADWELELGRRYMRREFFRRVVHFEGITNRFGRSVGQLATESTISPPELSSSDRILPRDDV